MSDKKQKTIWKFLQSKFKRIKKVGKAIASFLRSLLPTAIATVISTVIITCFGNLRQTREGVQELLKIKDNIALKSDLEVLKTEMDTIDSDISTIKSNINTINSEITDIYHDLGKVEGIVAVVEPEKGLYTNLTKSYGTIDETYQSAGQKLWDDENEIIAVDLITKEKYTVDDLYNVPILTFYTDEEGKDVYFYGQYNENELWDNKCILNIYDGNELETILEATYDDGNLNSYKRVFDEKDDTWTVTDRENRGEYNSGETFTYKSEKSFTKDFDRDNVSKNDMINVDDFLSLLNGKLMEYYNGKTSEERYNDDSGNAYLVKYKDDGDVQILYAGKFKDGEFHDKDGESWFISAGTEDPENYYYYKGVFADGGHETVDDWKPLTQKQINKILKGKTFQCKLPGLIPEDSNKF